ncbi:hypothetical protein ACFQY4_24295 [Catellatospora bangladeshensis]|uniref:Uncharacterized protein n=1 Tax=Catellatospora bangladeshensis TaxID=310355 RepID=A0A8J3JGA2_9ACTN|nr:hypothetical protein [Catellatospora bangladeshensis]GIF80116.1 hypothetical protein Cba03nite_14650 [Catellatospora bangladeshensis]
MALRPSEDALTALRDFVRRIHALDRTAPAVQELTLLVDGREERLALSEPVVKALVEALRVFHDPRDKGRCDYCGGPLDDNFLCRDCGAFSGVFGQLLAERAGDYTPPEELPPARG